MQSISSASFSPRMVTTCDSSEVLWTKMLPVDPAQGSRASVVATLATTPRSNATLDSPPTQTLRLGV